VTDAAIDKTVFVWTPGGAGVDLPPAEALALVAQMLANEADELPDTCWEVREPGVDCNEGEPELHRTLREAVEAAMPFWQDSGVDFVRAAFLAMVAGLVVSTGIEIEDTCPACGVVCGPDDATLADHGVCYTCHRQILSGARCGRCREWGYASATCPDVANDLALDEECR